MQCARNEARYLVIFALDHLRIVETELRLGLLGYHWLAFSGAGGISMRCVWRDMVDGFRAVVFHNMRFYKDSTLRCSSH